MDVSLIAKTLTSLKIADSPSITHGTPNKDNGDERSPSRFAATSGISRHRFGASPVRVKRSTNDSVPTAVVTPTPPRKAISGSVSTSSFSKMNDVGENRNATRGGSNGSADDVFGDRFSNAATVAAGGGSPLSRRSRSSVGSTSLGLTPTRLVFDDDAKSTRQRPEGSRRLSRFGDNFDAETQAPSNSILTLHSLLDDNRQFFGPVRDDSQDRRLREMETRLHEIERRLIASGSAKRRDATNCDQLAITPSVDTPKGQIPRGTRPTPATPISTAGVLSVAVPPMVSMDGSVFRVQPSTRAEAKVQREIERLEKKLKQHEETADGLRAQHHRQIEQLTRQLASSDDVTQTLRSRLRELELENELWQNRCRMYNDVDVEKLLQENERLRSRARRYSARDDRSGDSRAKEQLDEENDQLKSRLKELEEKYRSTKAKRKETEKAYRARLRQYHIELESLKVTLELQNSELSDLRWSQWNQLPINEPVATSATSEEASNKEFFKYNLDKCHGILDCLSKVCKRIKRRELLDPTEVLEYGTASTRGDSKSQGQGDEKSMDEAIVTLAAKLMELHSMVVDLYGDELANAMTCNVQ